MKAVTTSKLRDGTRRTQMSRVHKVLHCRNSVGSVQSERCGMTWNRDTNAAKNILMLALHELRMWQRPDVFCRSQKTNITIGSRQDSGTKLKQGFILVG